MCNGHTREYWCKVIAVWTRHREKYKNELGPIFSSMQARLVRGFLKTKTGFLWPLTWKQFNGKSFYWLNQCFFSHFTLFFSFAIRLTLGNGCTSGTWEPTHVQQLPLSMDLTNHWSTTLLLTAAGKAQVFPQLSSPIRFDFLCLVVIESVETLWNIKLIN